MCFIWPLIFFSISGSTGGGVHGDPGSERGPSGGRRFQGGGEADQEPAGGIDVQWGEELSNCLWIIFLKYDAQGPRRIDHKDRVLTLEVSQQWQGNNSSPNHRSRLFVKKLLSKGKLFVVTLVRPFNHHYWATCCRGKFPLIAESLPHCWHAILNILIPFPFFPCQPYRIRWGFFTQMKQWPSCDSCHMIFRIWGSWNP